MFDVKKFGAYISQLRKERDMTQSELGDFLNVTRQAISKWENGDSFPDISILSDLAGVFGISIDMLLQAGEATTSETKLLSNIALKKEIPQVIFQNQKIVDEIINVAPLLKISTLSIIADELSKFHININKVIELAEFMNNESLLKLINNSDYSGIDERLLEKLIPFLDKNSKERIFELILEGLISENMIKIMLPYMDASFYSLVEAAFVEGLLSKNSLKI